MKNETVDDLVEIQVALPPETLEWLNRLSANDADRRSELVRVAVMVHYLQVAIIEQLSGRTEAELGIIAKLVGQVPRSGRTCPCAGLDEAHRPGHPGCLLRTNNTAETT